MPKEKLNLIRAVNGNYFSLYYPVSIIQEAGKWCVLIKGKSIGSFEELSEAKRIARENYQ